MKRTRQIILSTAALATLALAGCVDNDAVGAFGNDTSVRRQAVTAVPEFVITGAEQVPESLFVSGLGLTISEIRLEPMWTTESLAYATREPMVIHFDVAGGQTSRLDEALELPAPGRYLVSIRLEPWAAEPGAEANSFQLDGFVSGSRSQYVVGEDMDGRPQPMPFHKTTGNDDSQITDQEAYPDEWTPFEYHSKRAVFYTFNDVELASGEQFLTFSFDVRDWAADVLEPISNAVRASAQHSDTVDVTNQIDSSGSGVDALIETGVVRSDRRPR